MIGLAQEDQPAPFIRAKRWQGDHGQQHSQWEQRSQPVELLHKHFSKQELADAGVAEIMPAELKGQGLGLAPRRIPRWPALCRWRSQPVCRLGLTMPASLSSCI